MVRALHPRRTLLGNDVLVTDAALAALSLVGYLPFQPLQLPRYLLVVAYDLVEAALPALSPYHAVGFTAFLYLLAVGGAAVARWGRNGGETAVDWDRAAGGACVVVGLLSLGFVAVVDGAAAGRRRERREEREVRAVSGRPRRRARSPLSGRWRRSARRSRRRR